MAAHVEVVSTDLRRVKVKVNPGTHLVDVLGEACQKLNLKSDKYLLKHKQKDVDLSGPFRTSGLSPGAKLELVQKSKSPSVVSIALDVLGRRFTSKLPSDMMLWQVLRQFESTEKDLNITGRAEPKSSDGGQLYYEAPVVNIMGREYSALEDLQKTLSQCGINSGSIVLRVTFKDSGKTLYQAMEEISQYLKEVEPGPAKTEETKEPVSAPAAKETTAEEVVTENAAKPEPASPEPSPPVVEGEPASDAMDVDTSPSPAPTPLDPLQPTSVFSAPSSSTPVAAQIREDDSAYEPTIAHAQLRQQQLLTRAQNKRLKSDAELATDAVHAAAELARVAKVDIKVRFPDQTSAQWVVSPEHTGAFLYQAIRGVMANPNQPFRLITAGPNHSINDDNKRLIADYKLKGRELLNLLWEDAASDEVRKAPFLTSSVASKAQAVVVPEVPQSGLDHAEPSAGPSTKPAKSEKESGLDSEAIKKKLGKFFKLPGKK